jgi:ATP-dependent RNA helicase RhlE
MGYSSFRHSSSKRRRVFTGYGGKPVKPQFGSKASSIDHKQLVKSAIPKDEISYEPSRTFDEMPIVNRLKDVLRLKGYTHPTEIQDKTLEYLIEGKDLIGIAKTGTGKTAAFLVPIIHRLLTGRPFQTLIMVPTRELAQQVHKEFISMSKGLGLHDACFIGGTGLSQDLQKAKRLNHVVIGTPGRLNDLVKRGALRMADFSVLVLDEFDRMLDMGFSPDVMRLALGMTNRKQTALFSATIDKTQTQLIRQITANPVEVKVSTGDVTADHVEQDVVRIPANETKLTVLLRMLAEPGFEKVLLFADTKRMVQRLHKDLTKAGVQVDQIHGDKSQSLRKKALERFREGRVKVLVATDVAARGLDISDVSHVINFQVPKDFQSYLHRIGRTGRAGKSGKALTFVG